MSKTKNSMSVASTSTAAKSIQERYSELLSQESLKSGLFFTLDRLPNGKEIGYTIAPNALIQNVLSPITNRFEGSHPTELIVFRDITKLAPIFAATKAGIPIGSTGIKYDISAFLGTARKAVYKVMIISGGVVFGLDKDTMSNLAIAANFICEPFARFPKIGSRIYQEDCKNCSLSYSEISAFQQKHYSSIIGETFGEAASKTFTSDIWFGSSLKPVFGFFGKYIDKGSNLLLKGASYCLTGKNMADFARARGPYEKAAAYLKQNHISSPVTKAVIYTTYFLIEWPAKIALEFSKSILFVPIVNAVSDGPGADWLFGSSIETGNTLTATAVAKGCIVGGVWMPYCFAAGMTTKVVLSEAYKSGPKEFVVGMDYMFGSGTKTTTTFASGLILFKCMTSAQNNDAKAVCVVAGAALLGLNSFNIEGSSMSKDAGAQAISAFHVVADAVHNNIEVPVVQALFSVGNAISYLYEGAKELAGKVGLITVEHPGD